MLSICQETQRAIPSALASLIQVPLLRSLLRSGRVRGSGRGLQRGRSPSRWGARALAALRSPSASALAPQLPLRGAATSFCPAPCLFLCVLSVSSPSFSTRSAHLLCWFRLSLAFFKGRQTGQSCRVQFFQWEMICREDAQWATMTRKTTRCYSSIQIVARSITPTL